MSQSFHQGLYNFPNAYERSGAEQGGFEALPPPQPSPAFDGGGMLTEIMNLPWRRPGGDVLDDQIQPSYRLPHKHQLSALAVNVAAAAEEVD